GFTPALRAVAAVAAVTAHTAVAFIYGTDLLLITHFYSWLLKTLSALNNHKVP
ncbi:MAG: hypothetical protein ACJAUP_000485, partial [Cellvibrionaceae bacterium]